MGPDPAGRRFLDRQLKSVEPGPMGPGGRRFQHVDLHQIVFRIMEDQADEVERRHRREALREIPKQRLEVTVSRDGLGHVQQGAVLSRVCHGGLCGKAFVHGGLVCPRQNRYATAVLRWRAPVCSHHTGSPEERQDSPFSSHDSSQRKKIAEPDRLAYSWPPSNRPASTATVQGVGAFVR